jgi:hypothetical protein
MQSATKKQSFTVTLSIICFALILGFASTGYSDVILGNWESADSNDGFVPGINDANAVLTPASTTGVTLGSGSLKVTPSADGSYWRLEWAGSPLNLTDARLQFDVTMVASEWPSQPWTAVAAQVAINSNGPSGWKAWGHDAGDDVNVTVTDRDTGAPSSREWGAWDGDSNRTFTVNVSDYITTGASYMQIHISVQDNNVFDGGNFYFDNFRLVTPDMIISKCKVTAGKTQYLGDGDYNNMKDSITTSGTINPVFDINDINNVVVTITSNADDAVIYTETLADFNSTVVNYAKGKYTHTAKLEKGKEGKITSLKLDLQKGTFAMTAKNVDLTGLACPFEIKFVMGSYTLKGNANETVVNGTKTIPTRLMRLYDDTLVVTKAKAKHNATKALSDKLSVTGGIAVEDMGIDVNEPNLAVADVNITWGDNDGNDQTFKIPAGSFKAAKKGNIYKCSKVVSDGNEGLITAAIDLDKCTFTVSVADANGLYVEALGNAVLGINFETPSDDFNEVDDYTLP